MWSARYAACAAACAIGCGESRPPSPLTGMDVSVSTVEWTTKASDPDHVDVAIVVDSAVNKLGNVEATPETCAIRSAAATVTELLCGNDSFVAEVAPGELVITHGREAKHVLIGPSIAITVAPYRMPTDP
jgi:hypothetical protein